MLCELVLRGFQGYSTGLATAHLGAVHKIELSGEY